MNYGLYLSAGGALTSMHRLDVISNNLANVNTVGFKPDAVTTQQRLPERLEDAVADANPREMLEMLGGGQLVSPTTITLAQGALESTGNTLDVAINGEGFFVVGGPTADSQSLTRDGRFTRDAQGRLALTTNGMPVRSESGGPIHLDATGTVSIGQDGSVNQNGAVVGHIRLVNADAEELTKRGDNLFTVDDLNGLDAAPGLLHQGHLEMSGVDPIVALNSLISASKAVNANAKMMQYHDNLLGQAINTLGRVV